MSRLDDHFMNINRDGFRGTVEHVIADRETKELLGGGLRRRGESDVGSH